LLITDNYFLRLKEQNIKPKSQLLLGLAVLFWLAGFDVIYSLQDHEFDQERALYSIPAGAASALCLSSLFHLATAVFLALVEISAHIGVIYWVTCAAVAIVLFWEHLIVAPNDLSRIDMEFFDLNAYVSLGDFLSTLADVNLNSSAGTVE